MVLAKHQVQSFDDLLLFQLRGTEIDELALFLGQVALSKQVPSLN